MSEREAQGELFEWIASAASRIHAGGSIGSHSHPISDDINYILSGTGKAICDGKEELLVPGTCHICKKGSEKTDNESSIQKNKSIRGGTRG